MSKSFLVDGLRKSAIFSSITSILSPRVQEGGLLELLGLLTILNHQSVQVSAASHLELGVGPVLLDLDGLGVFPSSRQQEIFDLLNLLRHFHASFFFDVFPS